MVGRVGDYGGDRHANESKGPGLVGVQNFGIMQERNDAYQAKGTPKELRNQQQQPKVEHKGKTHHKDCTLMPGSESICLEGTETGPCAGPDCGGGMGCHGYGMEDE